MHGGKPTGAIGLALCFGLSSKLAPPCRSGFVHSTDRFAVWTVMPDGLAGSVDQAAEKSLAVPQSYLRFFERAMLSLLLFEKVAHFILSTARTQSDFHRAPQRGRAQGSLKQDNTPRRGSCQIQHSGEARFSAARKHNQRQLGP